MMLGHLINQMMMIILMRFLSMIMGIRMAIIMIRKTMRVVIIMIVAMIAITRRDYDRKPCNRRTCLDPIADLPLQSQMRSQITLL